MSSTPPNVRRPQDLPDFRIWLLEQWQPGAPFDRVANIVTQGRSEFVATNPNWDRRALEGAVLWWISEPMVALLEAAAVELPLDIVLEPEMVPHISGLVYLERPLYGLDAEHEGHLVQVDMFVWGQTRLVHPYTGKPVLTLDGMERLAVGVESYRRFRLDEGLSSGELEAAVRSGAMDFLLEADGKPGTSFVYTDGNEQDTWAFLGRSDWPYHEAIGQPIADMDETRARSQAEDRRWLAALWFLASQPNIVESRPADIERQTRRRSERKNVEAKVRVVDLRRKIVIGPPVDGTPTGPRDWQCRWLVTGHWRNQRCGPGRKQVKRIWIPSYVKGPDDKPFRPKPTVKILR